MNGLRPTQRFIAGLVRFSLLLAVLAGFVPAASLAQEGRLNGAGLVVRHGDGTLIYAYVEFHGDSIGGEELLLRSGLDIVVTPFGGLGAAVCSIGGEGCPADDCFCQSYGSPSLFWRYFGWNGSGWEPLLHGPTGRTLRDGDIDGWSWSGGEAGLPVVTIDEIAAITGFSRSPVATPTATATMPASPTTVVSATSPPAPTATATASATSSPYPTEPPIQPARTGTAEPTADSPAEAATITPTPTTESSGVPTVTNIPTATPSPVPTEPASPVSQTAAPGTGAVIVRPGATPEPVVMLTTESNANRGNLLLFGGFALIIACAGGAALVRRRKDEGAA